MAARKANRNACFLASLIGSRPGSDRPDQHAGLVFFGSPRAADLAAPLFVDAERRLGLGQPGQMGRFVEGRDHQ
jgi:hypothetical protein